MAGVVDLVGAVYIDAEFVHLSGVKHLDAQCLQALGRGHRAGHRAGNGVLDGRQRVDEFVDGRAGANANDAAGLDVMQGGLANQGFEFVLSHEDFGGVL